MGPCSIAPYVFVYSSKLPSESIYSCWVLTSIFPTSETQKSAGSPTQLVCRLIPIFVITFMSDIRNGASSGPAGPSEPDQQKDPAASPSTKGKFKIATRVIMAMKRFQASLNPTYSYGKRTSDSGGHVEHTDGHRVLVQPRAAGTVSGRTTSGRTASGRTLSGRPTSAGQHHGYKANLLFRPLPDPDTAVKSG